MTVKTTDARWSAYNILRDRVLTDVLPHAERPRGVHRWDWRAPAEASALDRVVTDPPSLSVGDLVVVIDATRYKGDFTSQVSGDSTVRSIAGSNAARLYMVVGVTAARVKIVALNLPWHGYENPLAIEKGEWVMAYGITWQRDIVRTGLTFDQYREAIMSHPDWDRFVCFTDLAVKMQAEWDKARKAKDTLDNRKRNAAQEKVDVLNNAVGMEVATVTWANNPAYDDPRSMGLDGLRRLTFLALAGRLALGEITQEQHDAAALQAHNFTGWK